MKIFFGYSQQLNVIEIYELRALRRESERGKMCWKKLRGKTSHSITLECLPEKVREKKIKSRGKDAKNEHLSAEK